MADLLVTTGGMNTRTGLLQQGLFAARIKASADRETGEFTANRPLHSEVGAADQRKWLLLILATTVCYLYVSLFSLYGIPYFRTGDEDFFWTYACRLLSGQIFLKDFHQFTPPGTDLIYAAVFRFFGASLSTINWTIVSLGVALAFATYRCARSILPPSKSALPALLCVVLIYGDRLDATHHWFSSLADLLAIGFLLRPRTTRRIAAADIFLAFAAFCTQTRGAAGLIACCATFCFEWENRQISARTLGSRMALLCSVTLAVWLALSWHFIAQAGLANYWHAQVVYLPAGANFPVGFLVPPFAWSAHPVALITLLERIAIYLLLLLVCPWVLTLCLRRRSEASGNSTALFLLSSLGTLEMLEVVTALNWNRMAAVAIPSIILAIFLLDSGKAERRKVVVASSWLILATLVLAKTIPIQLRHYTQMNLPAGPALVQNEDAEEVLWLVHHTDPGDSFFEVANTRLYTLLDLRNPTPVDVLTRTEVTLPGWVTEVVQGLEQSRTHYILWSEHSGIGSVKQMHRTPHDHLDPLRSYMQTKYARVQIFANGDEIWERRDC